MVIGRVLLTYEAFRIGRISYYWDDMHYKLI